MVYYYNQLLLTVKGCGATMGHQLYRLPAVPTSAGHCPDVQTKGCPPSATKPDNGRDGTTGRKQHRQDDP